MSSTYSGPDLVSGNGGLFVKVFYQASLPVGALAIQAFAPPRNSFRSTLHNASAGPLSVMTMDSVVSKPQPSIHKPGMK